MLPLHFMPKYDIIVVSKVVILHAKKKNSNSPSFSLNLRFKNGINKNSFKIIMFSRNERKTWHANSFPLNYRLKDGINFI